MSRLLTLVAMIVVLAGCATYTWTKPGITPELMARDDTECRAQARDLASEYALAGGPFWGPRPWGPLWGPIGYRDPFWWYDDPGWRLQAEQRVYDRCMAFKGYRLVKEPKGER